jgi:hypothetical protein
MKQLYNEQDIKKLSIGSIFQVFTRRDGYAIPEGLYAYTGFDSVKFSENTIFVETIVAAEQIDTYEGEDH